MKYRYQFITLIIAVSLLLSMAGCSASGRYFTDESAADTPAVNTETEQNVPEPESEIEPEPEEPAAPSVRTKEQMLADFERDGQLSLKNAEEASIFLEALEEDEDFAAVFLADLEIPQLTPEEEAAAMEDYRQQTQQEAAQQYFDNQYQYYEPDYDEMMDDARDQLADEQQNTPDDFIDYDPSLKN